MKAAALVCAACRAASGALPVATVMRGLRAEPSAHLRERPGAHVAQQRATARDDLIESQGAQVGGKATLNDKHAALDARHEQLERSERRQHDLLLVRVLRTAHVHVARGRAARRRGREALRGSLQGKLESDACL